MEKVRGRPSIIPKEDYPQIIADVISGKRKPSEIAKDYKNADGKPIAQTNINRIIDEWRAKQNLSKRDTEDMVATIDEIIKMQTQLQAKLNQYAEVGNIIYAEVVERQRIKLQAYGYAPIIKKMKDKVNVLLDKNEVYELIGTGEGSQILQTRPETVQDFASLEKGVNILQKLSNMEYITQIQPSIAIQNNQTNNQGVEEKKDNKLYNVVQEDPEYQEFVLRQAEKFKKA